MPAPDNLLLRYLRRLGAGSLMISVIIHVIILSIATVYVVSSVKEKREAKFQGGSSGPSGPPAQTEHRVQMARQQQNLSAINQRLAVDSPNASVSLPDLPDMPGFSGGGPALGGGFSGSGGDKGSGAGLGKGPTMPSFGFREAQPGGSLVGRFYDFKQLADGKPNPDLARIQPGPLAEKELNTFTQGSWNPSGLARFYRAPTTLYATQLFIPNMFATEAPKAYGVEKTVQARSWVAHYRARVSPPSTGIYRFVGGGDDFMVVRMDGRIVLDGGLFVVSPFKTDRPDKPAYPYEFTAPGNNLQKSRRGGCVVGNRMELRAGLFYNLDILIGEGPGGHFYTHLMFEKEGETYTKDPKGNPILPIFRLAASPAPAPNPIQPPFLDNGPVWRSLPPAP